jgi:Golgi phosphoprotein 3
MELSFRSRIQVKKGDSRRRSYQDRVLEVIDESNTGEVLLDEALRYMKGDEDTVANWIDFLSGGRIVFAVH